MTDTQPEAIDAKSFLQHRDMLAIDPICPPEITLYSETMKNAPMKHWTPGYWQSRCYIESFLIDEADYDTCCHAPIQNFDGLTDGFKVDCFDAPYRYIPGEEAELRCEEAGSVSVEPVYFDQYWDGLGGARLLEPAQRLTLYLELEHPAGTLRPVAEWVDPYTNRVIIHRRDSGVWQDERKLTIRLDRLRDYLAARGKCLYVRRWGERFFSLQDDPITEIGEAATRDVPSGCITYDRRPICGAQGIEAILNQHFLVPPAPRPSHYKLRNYRDRETPVEFLDEQGETIKLDPPPNPMMVVSFRRQVLEQFRSNVDGGWDIRTIAPGSIWLVFPGGEGVHASDSPHGQVQCFLKDLHELDRKNQEYMRGFCEMSEGKPHPNWWLPSLGFGPPSEEPLEIRLNRAKQRICDAVSGVTNDCPFACNTEPLSSADLIPPHAKDGPAFARCCKEVYRKLLAENRPEGFVRAFSLTVPDGGKSIAVIKALCDARTDNNEKLVHPFRALNGFRQVDAHPKSMDQALVESQYDGLPDLGACFGRLFTELAESLEALAVIVEREVESMESGDANAQTVAEKTEDRA